MTLNEIIADFKEQGLSLDEDIAFYIGPLERAHVLSIYESTSDRVTPVIDIGYE